MSKRIAPEFVTLMLVCAFTLALTDQAAAALYKVSLKEQSKVLSTRMIDTENASKSGFAVHGGRGLAFEIQDSLASCNVFLQWRPGPKENADVMVSLIENTAASKEKTADTADKSIDKSGPARSVVSNSALLAKETIAVEDQNVYPGEAGTREVSVEAPNLNRTCTVSVL